MAFTAVDLKGRSGLFRVDVNTGDVSPIAYPISLTFQGPLPMPWTPTSDAVIVRKFAKPLDRASRGGELWLIPLDGGPPRRLAVDLGAAFSGQLGKIRLSPDRTQVAYVVGKFYQMETWVFENFLPRVPVPGSDAGGWQTSRSRLERSDMSLGVPASTATPVGRFRIVAFWEGISFLLLLFVAMPLKYGLGIDVAVRIVGMTHGVLFLGYCVTLAFAGRRLGARRSLLALVIAFVPGGTFWLEARLRQDEHEFEQRTA